MNSYSLNKVILVGSLGMNPIFDETKDGREYVRFSLATNEAYQSHGEWKRVTDWHSIVTYKKSLINFAEAKLRKGTKVIIEAKLKSIPRKEGKGRTVMIVADEMTLAIPNTDEQRKPRPKNYTRDDEQGTLDEDEEAYEEEEGEEEESDGGFAGSDGEIPF
jgi:single-strand DNA-binding protein